MLLASLKTLAHFSLLLSNILFDGFFSLNNLSTSLLFTFYLNSFYSKIFSA